MNFIPCGTASFLATRYYCGYNKTCNDLYKSRAKIKEIYDTRDGTICSLNSVACPC